MRGVTTRLVVNRELSGSVKIGGLADLERAGIHERSPAHVEGRPAVAAAGKYDPPIGICRDIEHAAAEVVSAIGTTGAACTDNQTVAAGDRDRARRMVHHAGCGIGNCELAGTKREVALDIHRAAIDHDRAAAGVRARESKRAGVDYGAAGVGVGAGEGERAGAVFRECTVAADRTGEGLVAVRPKDQRTAVGDGSGISATAEQPGGTDRERAGADRGGSGVGARAIEREGASAGFSDAATAADHTGVCGA